MALLRMGVSACALVALGAAWSQAQSTHAHVIVEPQGRPRLAGIAPPPPPPQRPSINYGPTVFANYPVVVTPDGQVFVDLGYGLEEVARACPNAYGYGCESSRQPIDSERTVFPSYIAPSYDAPSYAPPVYQAPVYPVPPNPVAVYTNSVIATARGYVRSGYAAPSRAATSAPAPAPATRLVATPRASTAASIGPRHATVRR